MSTTSQRIFNAPSTLGGSKKDPVNHVLIIIPGIRSDGEWINKIEHGYSHYRIVKTTAGVIPVFDLLARTRLWRHRYQLLGQITRTITKYPGLPVTIIAHSMGTALLAEIVRDINFQFDNIFLLGSICHQDRIADLRKATKRLVNDCGVNDPWPIRAQTFRGDKYSFSGVYGFNDGVDVINRRFYNDHFTCTSLHHIKTNIIPMIEGNDVDAESHVPYAQPVTTVILKMWAWRIAIYTPLLFAVLFLVGLIAKAVF